MILLIDNFDSFVFNLARYCERLGHQVQVVRNNAWTVEQVRAASPSAILLSPGPGAPSEAGISLSLLEQLGGSVPILGVCLGHQAIAQAYGARVDRSPEPMHGRAGWIEHGGTGVFAGLPSPLQVGRYHSLLAREDKWPESLEVTARTSGGLVMAVQHRTHPTVGLQFHPESILTQGGYQLLHNFFAMFDVVAECEPSESVAHCQRAESAGLSLETVLLPLGKSGSDVDVIAERTPLPVAPRAGVGPPRRCGS